MANWRSEYRTQEKKGKRKVQGVPQSQTAALPRHQEEQEYHKQVIDGHRQIIKPEWNSLLFAFVSVPIGS